MKKAFLLFLCINTFLNCQSAPKTTFSEAALADTFEALDGNSVSFETILDQNVGKTIFIDVWASWCKDCIESLPQIKALQAAHPELVYVFLSLDKSAKAWKKGIDRYALEGDHYFMSSGWKGPMGTFLDLDWIPRFVVVNPEGGIAVYRAIETTDKNLIEYLK